MGSETVSGQEWAARRTRDATYEQMTDDELRGLMCHEFL